MTPQHPGRWSVCPVKVDRRRVADGREPDSAVTEDGGLEWVAHEARHPLVGGLPVRSVSRLQSVGAVDHCYWVTGWDAR